MPAIGKGSIGVPVRKATIDGLATHFAALDGFNGTTAPERDLEVSYGYSFTSRAAEKLYTGRSQAETPPAAMRPGRNHRDETGTFQLNIHVQFVGGDAYEADQRVDGIADEVETWIADRKSNELGIDGLLTLRVESWDADYAGIDGGTASTRTITVRWTARLT